LKPTSPNGSAAVRFRGSSTGALASGAAVAGGSFSSATGGGAARVGPSRVGPSCAAIGMSASPVDSSSAGAGFFALCAGPSLVAHPTAKTSNQGAHARSRIAEGRQFT
jgi:hypothetical protein